jgi:DNA ligase-1
MYFHNLATFFDKLDKTTLRNEMTEILAELFERADIDEIDKLCYLLQGRVAPLYEKIEFGVADKMIIRAISSGLNITEGDVNQSFKRTGDLGDTAMEIKLKATSQSFKKITVNEVFQIFKNVSNVNGDGSQEEKINLIGNLITQVDPLSAKYVVRIILGKLRLGFSDMTILDGLSWMLNKSKELKKTIESAYKVRPDLGYIAYQVKKHGIDGVNFIQPQTGTPILMARANRLSSPMEILEKIGKCAIEYKYDGLRLQVHYAKVKNKNSKINNYEIKMYSRNLEEITAMFPDIERGVVEQINADDIIFEGEVVAYNPKTGVFVPFQETMQRKRKYDIESKALEIPVRLFVFELLYLNGKSLLNQPYNVRKKALKEVVLKGKVMEYANEKLVDSEVQIEKIFHDSVDRHFEGIIAKKLDGLYEAGMRGWNWIKYKKAMSKKLADTVDVLVMGYTLGEGKRTSFGVGQFLTGIYDEEKNRYVTVSKIGTGLTDDQFREFKSKVKGMKIKEKPLLYDVDKLLEPDIWLTPGLVVEIGCDEITRSAVHTAGRVMKPSKSGKALSVDKPGFALRFPKLVTFRDDKRPDDITTLSELTKMYEKQK